MAFLFITVLLTFLVIALLWRRPFKPIGGWITTMIMALGVTGFSVLVSPWGILGLPVRYLIILLFLLALVASLRRAPDPDRPPESAVRMLVKIAIGVFFGAVAVSAIRSFAVPAGAINLAFPLRGGSFLVLHGGSGQATNLHGSHERQKYGLDIVGLWSSLRRARGIRPDEPGRYAIWGREVVAPCSGQVLAAVDGRPEQRPGQIDPGQFRVEKDKPGPPTTAQIAGNHVVLRCGGADVWLAHLQRGSVTVTPGAQVTTGARVGLVGNSGLTTEPHLHVHVERDGKAVPARFDERWLVRNAIVRK